MVGKLDTITGFAVAHNPEEVDAIPGFTANQPKTAAEHVYHGDIKDVKFVTPTDCKSIDTILIGFLPDNGADSLVVPIQYKQVDNDAFKMVYEDLQERFGNEVSMGRRVVVEVTLDRPLQTKPCHYHIIKPIRFLEDK